jgi:hypothetical protein
MPTTADDAKLMYETELKQSLERDFLGQHVAIVSQSRRHFVRPTFLEAALAAREAEPDHVPFVIRIGHDAAFHIGAVSFWTHGLTKKIGQWWKSRSPIMLGDSESQLKLGLTRLSTAISLCPNLKSKDWVLEF